MNEETLKKIMYISCSNEEGKRKLKGYLTKLKPLKKYAEGKHKDSVEIPTDVLEKVVHKIMSKYMVEIQGINLTLCPKDGVSYYSVSMIDKRHYNWIGTAYACTLNEVMGKIALALFLNVKLHEIPTREEYNKGRQEEEKD